MNALRTAAALGLLAAALAASAQQSVAYNSLGYPSGGAAGVGDVLQNSPASLFVPTVSGALSGLVVNIDSGSANPDTFNVRLFSNVPPTATSGAGSTDTEGVQLALFTATASYNPSPYNFSVPVTSFPLVAGTKYWLQLDGGSRNASGNSYIAWYQQSGAPATTTRNPNGYGTDRSPYGFTVLVGTPNPTPEPSALAALGLGAVAVLRRRKRA